MNIAAIAALARGDIDNALVAATPGGIEAQEAAGQATMCLSSILPKECPRAELEKFGVVFGTDHDDLFVKVTLPAGWKKSATEHSMHSDLLDDKGRKRGSIFYKAAFYDRRADMQLVRRYSVNCYLDGSNAENYRGAVFDGTTEIHDLGQVARNAYHSRQEQHEQGAAWLTERYPDWQDATAYWD